MQKLILFILTSILTSITLLAQTELSIMSYNIRLGSVDDGENHWNIRKQKLVDLIQYYEADFIGVQEAQMPQIDFIKASNPNLKFIGDPRSSDKNAEYSGIFYQADKFKLLSSKTTWLSQTPEVESKGWDASYLRIVTYGLFENIKTKKKFWIINTHLDNDGKIARQKSLEIIDQLIHDLNSKHKIPTFFMGDFNMNQDDQSLAFIRSKYADTRTNCKQIYGPDYTWEAFKFHTIGNEVLDYIFFKNQKGIRCKSLNTIDDFYDYKFPSDHLPILAKFILD